MGGEQRQLKAISLSIKYDRYLTDFIRLARLKLQFGVIVANGRRFFFILSFSLDFMCATLSTRMTFIHFKHSYYYSRLDNNCYIPWHIDIRDDALLIIIISFYRELYSRSIAGRNHVTIGKGGTFLFSPPFPSPAYRSFKVI